MEGGKEQNYWPGFVDALSNVVLTLVFVLVIFVFALVMASSKVEQELREKIEAEQNVKGGQSQLSVDEKTVDMGGLSVKGDVEVAGAGAQIVLNYPVGVSALSAESEDKLKAFVENIKQSKGLHKLVIRASLGAEVYSTARRLAYYRAIGVRSYFMKAYGIPAANIEVSIVNSAQSGEGRVEIIFRND